jgi:hypothetical protein
MPNRHILTGTALLALGNVASAGEINTGYFGDVAIRGYDPVAYFTMSKAVEGDPAITLAWLGANWQFATEEHRDLFAEDPISYAPQYGGHCSDGLAYDTITVNIDPDAWRIIEGKLYLNFDQGAAEEIEVIPGQIEKADANWQAYREGLADEGTGD